MRPIYEESGFGITVYHQASGHVPPHLHKSIEFVYVTKGELALGVGQELHAMQQGDLAIVFPELIHHFQCFASGENTACHILASPALATRYLTDLSTSCPVVPVLPAASLHPDIPYAVSALMREFDIDHSTDISGDRDRDTLALSYIHILLARSLPAYDLVEKVSFGSDDIIYQTVSYISAHFQESVTLTSMAHDLGVSPFALSRVFSGTFHRNFNQYLNEVRLDYACTLLRYTKQPITELCLEAGFESQRTFNRVFRETYRMSPRVYRQRGEMVTAAS